ncbi:MAG: hypothetical protein OXG98_14960 [Gemmatimonadetes bacterium]|nr:hypothetical protein [Gemmatimonadota bacterium]
MNDPKRSHPTEEPGMNPRVIDESVKRIEDDMYFSSDSIKVRLARIEEKLENVVTKEDLEANMMGLKTELIAHTNSTFRWTIGLYMVGAGVLLTVLKLT